MATQSARVKSMQASAMNYYMAYNLLIMVEMLCLYECKCKHSAESDSTKAIWVNKKYSVVLEEACKFLSSRNAS
jgi:hypothetical protein